MNAKKLTYSILGLALLSATGCAELLDDPRYGGGHNDPYRGRDGYYDPYYDRDYDRVRRERRELDRERDRIERERDRLEDERERRERDDRWRQPPPPPPPPPRRIEERCPSGFSPSEQKCSREERRRGCQDMRLPGGLGCVKR